MARRKESASAGQAPPTPRSAATVPLTGEDVRALRRMLEGVMTLASHGILFRFGQLMAESVVADARARGGPLEATALLVLEERGWVAGAQAFPQRVKVSGSIEVDPEAGSGEPTCHILRGMIQRAVEASRGPHAVREVECASAGAAACVFEVVAGRRGA
jgi:predicted hydrocarbon binding protein